MIRAAATAVGALVLVASACGTQVGTAPPGGEPAGQAGEAPSPTATSTGGPRVTGTGMTGPPPYRLRYDRHELVLRPHTWCYDNGCVDGVSRDAPSVGSPEVVYVHVPLDGWRLAADFSSTGRCGRQQTVRPEPQGDGWYRLEPAGPAGEYDVDLFAQGDGDMIARFRWSTRTDGPTARPHARLALIAEHDGRPDSYGVELALTNLAETPRSATARVTATAANGRSLTFRATRVHVGCDPQGMVYFGGPDRKGKAAAALGSLPFHYAVTVTLDGRKYHAAADYPADEIKGNEPSVTLRFTPALPRLQE